MFKQLPMLFNLTFLIKTKTKKFKFLFAALIFLISGNSSQATNYYFSSSTGNDSYTSVQAQNQATPWKSIAKLNSFFSSIVAGDNIYFKSGDVFYGTIVVSKSGSSGNPITISAYGAGNKPVISGLTSISSWTSLGGGIYQSSTPAVKNTVNLVTINGVPQAVGRFPNIDAANGGYLSYESYSGGTSITDNELTSATNWTGAEVVIRKYNYLMERCKVTNHSGSTLTYTTTNYVGVNSPVTSNGNNGNGYFIQRDARTLDQFGEWFFNTSTKNMQLYFGANSPGSYNIQVSTLDTLLNLGNKVYINVNNLSFEGANSAAIYGKDGSNITIQSCDLNLMGAQGIFLFNSPNVLIESINTNNILCNAINVTNRYVDNVTVRNCRINKTGALPGMGSFWDDNDYNAISVNARSNSLMEYNQIDSTGYIGIHFQGNNVMIKNNFINNYDFVKDDGGAIYTFAELGGTTYTNRVIKDNIILNGIGAGKGVAEVDVDGIFLDGAPMNVDILNNTMSNIGVNGIYCNNPVNINIRGNTSFNNGSAIGITRYASYGPSSNLSIKKNIFYPKFSSQNNFEYINTGINVPNTTSIQATLQGIGNIDSNYYSTPNATGFNYYYSLTEGGAITFPKPISLGEWRSYAVHDMATKLPPVKIASYTLNNLIGSNLLPNGQFTSDISGVIVETNNNTSKWDNTSKITGTGSLSITPTTPGTDFTLVRYPIGAVSSSKKYIFRFTTLGSATNGVLKAYIRKTGSPYNALVPIQTINFGTSKTVNEFLFTSPTSDADASFVIEIRQNSGTTYIDDMAFYEADATVLNIDSQLRLEYNASTVDKTIALDAKYLSPDSTVYDGSITLSPYSSKILIKAGPATNTGAPIIPTTLSASATAPPISCFGGSTVVTVSGSGGSAPITGTGSFNVNAGKGTLKITVPDPSLPRAFTLLYSSIGPVSSSKSYIFRFSTLGTTANGSLKASFRQTNSPYAYITPVQVTNFGTTRVNHEFLFTAPTSDANASFLIEILQSSGTTYVDNIAVFEATPAGALISDNLYANGQFESGISGITPWSETTNYIAEWDVSSKISNTYYYPVKDATGAISTATALTTQPVSALQATSSAGTITVSGGTTTVVVSATGGTAPYTGTGSFTNVKAGTYNYTVTDANGCTSVTTITVVQQTSGSLSASATVPSISCFGGNTSVTISGSGGVAPLTGTGTFNVSAGKGTLKVTVPDPSLPRAFTLLYSSIGTVSSSKSYILRFSTLGTTANGSLKASFRQTNSPWAYITPVQVASFGTTRVNHEFLFTAPTTEANASFLIEILQSSGTTYVDNIAVFEATPAGALISDNLYANGQFESGISGITPWSETTNYIAEWDVSSKISNTYYYPVKDATGAISTATALTTQPVSALQASSSAGTITVSGGTTTVVVSATGGTAPYTGTGSFTNVKAGTYNYTVTDANGCSAITTITITQSATPLAASASVPVVNCFGGSVTASVTASGGTAPLTGTGSFLINAGIGSLKVTVPNPTLPRAFTLLYSTIGSVSNSKNYILRFSTLGTTANGSLKASFRQTNSPWAYITPVQLASFGTTRINHEFLFTAPTAEANASFLIEILQSSGTTYIDNIAVFEATSTGALISDNLYGSGQFETGITGINAWSETTNYIAEWDVTGKISNTFYYPVKDATGAISTATAIITQPASVLLPKATSGAITTTGGTTTVIVSATGGTAPYSGTGTFTNVKAGTYNYTVTDANGCSAVTTITVSQTAVARSATPNTVTGSIVPTNNLSPVDLQIGALKISCFPNPSTYEFGLILEGGTNEIVDISLLNIDGRIVYKTQGTSNKKYTFGNNLMPGIYFIRVIQGTTLQSLKVVKIK